MMFAVEAFLLSCLGALWEGVRTGMPLDFTLQVWGGRPHPVLGLSCFQGIRVITQLSDLDNLLTWGLYLES